MNFFDKITHKEGQHTAEYIVVITLIMAGIIIAGPYVIRSWNANLKGWEDSALDSLQDQLIEGQPESVSVEGCDQGGWKDIVCAGGIEDICSAPDRFQCSSRFMLMENTWSPGNCECIPRPPDNTPVPVDQRFACEERCSCCDPWPALSTNPALCGANVGCPDGYERQTVTCGLSCTQTRCISNPSCVFKCTSTWFNPAAPGTAYLPNGFCTDGGVRDDRELLDNTPFTFVVDAGSCTAVKCEYQCRPTFYPDGNILATKGTYCACPSLQHESSGSCVCDDGAVLQGTCPEGQCYQGSCGAGQCQS